MAKLYNLPHLYTNGISRGIERGEGDCSKITALGYMFPMVIYFLLLP